MALTCAKTEQVRGLLEELDLDLWLVAVRETPVMADPVIPLVIGCQLTWESFFAFCRNGHNVALVGNFDVENLKRHEGFDDVRAYTAGVGEDLRRLLREIDPTQIALNYSPDDPSADGLTHGMFLQLHRYLGATPYVDRFVSAEKLCGKLRSRKLPEEIARIVKAADLSLEAWNRLCHRLRTGQSEREVGAMLDGLISESGGCNSFPTIVNAGDKSAPGHGLPTDARLSGGDLLHVDFGVRLNDYCSDLQRLVYFRRSNEATPPPELIEAFNQVRDIITETARLCRPGIKGFEIDDVARRMLSDNGYEEYQHALGHQLGRSVHDGGGLIGPMWERYGEAPLVPLESGNVFTLELEIILPGIGCVGLEEDVVVEETGGRFLCPRQMELHVL
ncbi:MAG TPA: Xaa-Pro peptidase family protein [candidate division Zixibacteria bacterium]|nr:Xaa-Pro peptidase family protein [candidate division Zixibacteria bacterium]